VKFFAQRRNVVYHFFPSLCDRFGNSDRSLIGIVPAVHLGINDLFGFGKVSGGFFVKKRFGYLRVKFSGSFKKVLQR